MKKEIIAAALLFSGFAYGQEDTAQVDEPKSFFEKSSVELTEATGKVQTEDGEWLEYKNVLSGSTMFRDKYPELQGRYMMSQYNQNFIDLQTHTFSHNGSEYVALVVEKWVGTKTNADGKRHWNIQRIEEAFVFERGQFNQLNSGVDTLNIAALWSVSTSEDDSTTLDEAIAERLAQPSEEVTKEEMMATTTTVNEEDEAVLLTLSVIKTGSNVRFYVPSTSKSPDRPINFEEAYFEAPSSEFSKLLI